MLFSSIDIFMAKKLSSKINIPGIIIDLGPKSAPQFMRSNFFIDKILAET